MNQPDTSAPVLQTIPLDRLKAIIEAALLASSQPMNLQHLGDLFTEEEQVDRTQIAMALDALKVDCEGRGIELREVSSGFRYQVRQEVHPWISRMWSEKPSRYSRALLETLALIAYRQPITRPEIEQIRGVVVSSNIIKTLEEREWIRVVGYRDVPGKPALFGTTRAFLDYFNLKSLDELPPLSEIRDLEDPQLRLDQPPLPARIIRDLPIDPDDTDLAEVTLSAPNEPAPTAAADEIKAEPPLSPDLDFIMPPGRDANTSLPTADEAASSTATSHRDQANDNEEPSA